MSMKKSSVIIIINVIKFITMIYIYLQTPWNTFLLEKQILAYYQVSQGLAIEAYPYLI